MNDQYYETLFKIEKEKKNIEKEKKNIFVNVLGFFFSIIPTLITIFQRFWIISDKGIEPQVLIPINALGVFTISSHFVNTLSAVLKEVPREKKAIQMPKAEFVFSIALLIIYGTYIVVVPLSYFIGYQNDAITIFSFWALILKAIQSLVAMIGNIGNITKLCKNIQDYEEEKEKENG